jgi:hypothetical protein
VHRASALSAIGCFRRGRRKRHAGRVRSPGSPGTGGCSRGLCCADFFFFSFAIGSETGEFARSLALQFGDFLVFAGGLRFGDEVIQEHLTFGDFRPKGGLNFGDLGLL